MLEDIYYQGNTFIHKFDARAKLIALAEFVIFFFFPVSITILAVFLLFIMIFLIVTARINSLLNSLKAILPLLILVLFITPFFNRTGNPILIISGKTIFSHNGIMDALRLAIRFTGITLSFTLYFKTTSMENMILSLRWFGLSFNLSLVITISLRYIPYILSVYRNVVDAHKLRKSYIQKRKATFITKIRNIRPVLISVLIYSIKKIPILAMVLEKKGIGRKNRRTSYLKLKSIKLAVPDMILLSILTIAVFSTLFLKKI
ncbi:MAG: hypothetical protein DRP57_10500 [Spirochaetes bacterium]|nr:MAG: hypothetical protein DRP57_10500 [Spirochaetota bacterium]